MKREYWFILLAYVGMQLSSFIGVPLVSLLVFTYTDITGSAAQALSAAIWLVFSFVATLCLVVFLLRHERNDELRGDEAPVATSILWAISGVFLAMFAQGLAASIERLIGIEVGSENTQQILKFIEAFPIIVLVSSVIGPILEEIVFRKIIFGSLYARMNFFFSALISSVIFAVAHMELEHTLLYSAMGFTFAYLYVKTKRILVPIFAHVAMNTLVVLMQSVYKEDIERMMREAEQMQSFIGGFFS